MNDEVENVVDGEIHATETEQSDVDLLEAVEDENEVTDADTGTETVETVETDLDAEAEAERLDEAEANGEAVVESDPESDTEIEKKVFYKIFLNKDGVEYKREIRGQGRVPADATRDADNNTVIPWREPREKVAKSVETVAPPVVVAETVAPPVVVVEPAMSAEPADQI